MDLSGVLQRRLFDKQEFGKEPTRALWYSTHRGHSTPSCRAQSSTGHDKYLPARPSRYDLPFSVLFCRLCQIPLRPLPPSDVYELRCPNWQLDLIAFPDFNLPSTSLDPFDDNFPLVFPLAHRPTTNKFKFFQRRRPRIKSFNGWKKQPC